MEGRAENGFVDRQIIGGALPRVRAARDAVGPRHEDLAEIARRAFANAVGDDEFMPAVAQARQTCADGDDPCLVLPSLYNDLAPRSAPIHH